MAALTGSRDFVTGSDQRALTAPTCLSQILLDKYSQDKYWTHTGQIRNRTNWENTQQEHHSSTKTRNTSKVTNTQIHINTISKSILNSSLNLSKLAYWPKSKIQPLQLRMERDKVVSRANVLLMVQN